MRQHINRRANQNPMGNWGNWDWFRARDAMTQDRIPLGHLREALRERLHADKEA